MEEFLYQRPLLSIVVPVFNVEKYLDRCIASIIGQTYDNWELILIDDGSTDGSAGIADDYAMRDIRIKVLHIENAGVSNARNVGMECARGQYVGFVDSDDWIESEMYEKMVTIAEVTGSDLVQVSYSEVTEDGAIKAVIAKNTGYIDNSNDIMYLYAIGELGNCVWNKLFKKELLDNVKFDVNYTIGEDAKFVYDYCKKACSVNLDAYVGYNYLIRNNSAMRQEYRSQRILYLNFLSDVIADNSQCKRNKCAFVAKLNAESLDQIKALQSSNQWRKYYKKVRSHLRRNFSSVVFNKMIPVRIKIISIVAYCVPYFFRYMCLRKYK